MNEIWFGDAEEKTREMVEKGYKAQMCVTSPPYYGLQDYGAEGQIGQETTPDEFIDRLVRVFRQVRELLHDDGTLWVNIGDTYNNRGGGPSETFAYNHQERHLQSGEKSRPRESSLKLEGLKTKDLIGIPWMLAFALRADGWFLRQDIIWSKGVVLPESVKDRCTKSHEYLFLLSKNQSYYFDHEAIREPAVSKGSPVNKDQEREYNGIPVKQANMSGRQMPRKKGAMGSPEDGLRNKRSVWHVNPKPYKGAHFAVFPPELITPCILAGSRPGDTVFDPFMGSGTTAQVALTQNRKYLGTELNLSYKDLQDERIASASSIFFEE